MALTPRLFDWLGDGLGFGARRLLLAAAILLPPQIAAAQAWPETLQGHGGPVKSVAVDASGDRLLSTSFDYAALVWDKAAGEGALADPLRLVGHDAAVNHGAFLSGNRAVTVGDDSALILWDLTSGTILHRADGAGEKVLGLAVSADERYVAVASWANEARLYQLEPDRLILRHRLTQHRNNVNAVAFSADGGILYTASYDGGIRAFDTQSGSFLREIANLGWGVNVIEVLPGGGRLLFGVTDGKLGVLDTESGQEVKILPPHSRPVLSLALSADGQRAASGGGDGLIRVFATDGFELLEEFENPYGPVWGLAFTAQADSLFYVGLDDEVHVWQVAPRKPFEPVLGTFPRRFQVAETDDPGALQFARKCSVCHTLTPDDANRAGPTLYGVFGRKAGTVPGYPYSNALKDLDLVWTAQTISDLFDLGPDVVTPGSKMPIQRLKSVEDRDALVAYLEKATDPDAHGGPRNNTKGD
ncbi:hypothetical protein GCM10011316_12460 [Roseibium aquae]|uniref:Cytochrome c domain-containing protein n=1 Tax=Roseibium aquae TaxID=1323746 RepID=A0A916TF11_9HYPH|nr:c-type cytochrome [Roseibium aquae]GGB41989.1 hypothetical protein GCM10011316_12460 [Roseibium aquae]